MFSLSELTARSNSVLVMCTGPERPRSPRAPVAPDFPRSPRSPVAPVAPRLPRGPRGPLLFAIMSMRYGSIFRTFVDWPAIGPRRSPLRRPEVNGQHTNRARLKASRSFGTRRGCVLRRCIGGFTKHGEGPTTHVEGSRFFASAASQNPTIGGQFLRRVRFSNAPPHGDVFALTPAEALMSMG